MVFLHRHGVGTARAVRFFRTYGADAVQVMTENPYRLARDIRGIGFVTADATAMKLGMGKTAMVRVCVGSGHDVGHVGLDVAERGPRAASFRLRCSRAPPLTARCRRAGRADRTLLAKGCADPVAVADRLTAPAPSTTDRRRRRPRCRRYPAGGRHALPAPCRGIEAWPPLEGLR